MGKSGVREGNIEDGISDTQHSETDFAMAHESPGYLLWLMSNRWQARQRLALKDFELTHVQFVLLASLVYAPSGQSLTQIQLAERAQTDPMMTSQVLRKLEEKGLVERTTSPKDRRAVSLRATDQGIELVQRAIVAAEAVDEAFFSVLGKDMPGFVEMMKRLFFSGLSNEG